MSETQTDVDAVIVGAGMAGMYSLHRCRQLGISTRVFEVGSDVGGTWFWNRYPGARCDVPCLEYSFSFDDDLQQEWRWSEAMAAQPEILDYLSHVADRLDLRSGITFDTKVTSTTFDEATNTWTSETDTGERVTSRFVVFATGCLSVPLVPDIAGMDDFAGTLAHTGNYPEGLDLSGKRVAVVGTGSSGVQTITEIAGIVGELTVFQRTPTYTYLIKNAPLVDEAIDFVNEHAAEFRERQRQSYGGFSAIGIPAGGDAGIGGLGPTEPGRFVLQSSEDELRAVMDEYGFLSFFQWGDWPLNPQANAKARELYGDLVHEAVQDPEVADALSPNEHPLGCKRPVFDIGYFDQYNRDNVSLVDLRKTPIERIVPEGIRTSDRTHEFDVIILATGFDAMTGALNRVDIRGRDGRLLRDKWAEGPTTYLGLQAAGYPNLFMVTGPGSPSVLSNMVVSIEQHVEWITDCIVAMRDAGQTTIEPTQASEDQWVEQVNQIASMTMLTDASCNSWYLGANVPGKTRVFMPYVGGVGNYRNHCTSIAEKGYEGFVLT